MMNACTRRSLLAVPVLTALGCSDPVPLPSQGSVTLDIRTGVATPTCPITKVYQVGSPAPTSGDPGQSVIDGDKGSSVQCSVQGSGPFTFSGSLSATTSESQPITVTLSNGIIDANKTTGTVDVAVITPELAASFSNGSTPCTVTANNMQVKPGNPGSIWVNFSCPTISSPPSYLCGIGSSTIVFQNCND